MNLLPPGSGHRRQPDHPGRVHGGGEDDGRVVEAADGRGHGGSRVPYRNRPAGQNEGLHAGALKKKAILCYGIFSIFASFEINLCS